MNRVHLPKSGLLRGISRRLFGKLSIGVLLIPTNTLFPEEADQQKLGLFADDELLEGIRWQFTHNEIFAEYRTSLERFEFDAAYTFLKEEVRFNDQLFHMRRLTDMVSERAFHYLMTGNQNSAELAITAVEAIMQFERWDYFLDGDIPIGFQRASRATAAVSLCIDWLGDLIEDSQRTTWMEAVAQRGCEPCYRAIWGMRYPDQINGWAIDPSSTYFEHRPGDRGWDLSNWPYIFDTNNLKAEPAAALTIGALAYERLMETNTATDRWLEQAMYSLSG